MASRAKATLQMSPTVALDGCKHKWKIMNDEEWITMEDGRVFLMLSVQNSSLAGLIAGGEKRTAGGGAALTLSQSLGFQELTQKRNDESRLLWAQEQQGETPSLFDVPTPKVMKTGKHADRSKARTSAMDVTVHADGEVFSITVLRPAHPMDKVFIMYEARNIELFFDYVRMMGFAGSKRRRSCSLPKGVNKHARGYLVTYVDGEGTERRRLTRTREEALIFHSNPMIDDGADVDEPSDSD